MMLHCSVSSLLVVLSFLSLATPSHCDEEQQQFGGNPIRRDQYLWFTALVEGIEEDDFICSGALISPRHVITADHCLRGRYVDTVWVRIGYFCPKSDNCLRTFTDRNVIEHRRNPSLGDVAILVLSSKVPSTFVPAIPDVGFPSYLSSIRKGDEMLMVGAGRDGTSEKVAKQAETLKIQLEHSKFKKCRNAISNEEAKKQFVSKSTICSVSDQGKPCQGDSGSAILVEGADSDSDVIVAVHNYGPRDCSAADDDSLFGHVSVTAVADFVISVVCVGSKKEKWCASTSFPTPSPPPPPPSPPVDTATCMEVCSPCVSAEVCAPFISAEACAPFSDSSCPPSPTLAPTHVLKGDSIQATLLHDLTNHSANVHSVAFDATSSRLASADFDKIVYVWDPSTGGSPQMTFRLDGCCPNALAFNPAETILAVGDGHDVALLDVQNTNNAKNPRKLQGHTNTVNGVAWRPDGTMLASGAYDNTVKLWDVATGDVLYTSRGHSDEVWAVSFDRRGRYLASASFDDTIRLLDVSTLSHVRTLRGHTSNVRSVAFSPDGTKLASGSWDDTVRVWRASDGSPLGIFSVGSNVISVAWSPDGQFVVSGSNDGVVRIWDANKDGGEALLEMRGHSDFVLSVVWSGNGKWIASGSFDDTVKVWEISGD